jgi:8-oxo-dGTP diphosphatase
MNTPQRETRNSEIETRNVIEVSAGLIFRSGKLLITQRHADSHLGGLWEFPGGKRESGETFEQCLVRELQEELGVEVVVGNLLDELTHSYPERTVRLKFFACRLKQGEPQPIGCAAVQWVSQQELADYSFPAADARLLDKLRVSVDLWR